MIEVVVSACVFFDVDVALGDVGFGLVVVVVTHEILDRVVREKLAEFFVELGGECLVVTDDERGLAQAHDGVGHGEGLARAGGSQEAGVASACVDSGDEVFDRCGLIPCGLEGGDNPEGAISLYGG